MAKVTRVFVIGPIGNKFASHGDLARQIYEDSLQVFEDVILAACQLQDLEPIRADQISVAGEIPDQVFRHLLDDDIVIADVSGGNANVMYELGLRHTTGKTTIQIGEFGQLPFDLSVVRTIQFSRSPRGLIDARNQLSAALQSAMLQEPELLTPARIWRDSLNSADFSVPAAEIEAGAEDTDDAPGLLDNFAEVEQEMQDMTANMERISETIEKIGLITQGAAADIEKSAQVAASNSARLSVIARYAQAIKEPTEILESEADAFAERMGRTSDGVMAILRYMEAVSDENRPEDSEDFLDQLISLAESAREGMEGINSFGSEAQGLGALSRQLRGPGNKIAHAVKVMRKAAGKIDEWERSARLLKGAS
jgi:hypothetical protein